MFNQIFGFLESFLVAFWPRVLFLQISKIFLSFHKLSFSFFTTSVLIANLWSRVQNLSDPTEQGLLHKIAQQGALGMMNRLPFFSNVQLCSRRRLSMYRIL